MQNIDVVKHARNKGHILEILKADYPNAIDFMVLRRCLSLNGVNLIEKELSGYLKYLANEGYISYKTDNNGSILYVELANKGHNLLDGYITDKTIILG